MLRQWLLTHIKTLPNVWPMELSHTQLSVKRACLVVSGQSRLARLLGVSVPTVNQWISGKRPVPIPYCVAIEHATNGAVTRKDLRPDDWYLIWPELAEKVQASDGLITVVTPDRRASERRDHERRAADRRQSERRGAKGGA